MATGTQARGKVLDYEQFIDHQLRRTRSQITKIDVLSAGLTLVTVGLAVLFLEVVLDHVFALSLGIRRVVFLLGVGLGGTYAALRIVRPLIASVNGLYAAKTIETSQPEFKNGLINYLSLRKDRETMPRSFLAAIEARAVDQLRTVDVEGVVNQRRVLHTAYALSAIVVIFCFYVALTPKQPWDSVKRAMLFDIAPPTDTRLENIVPGDKGNQQTVTAGDHVTFKVEVDGKRPDRVVLHASVDGGDFFAEQDFAPGPNKYDAWQTTLRNVQRSTDYYLTGGDARSKTYHVEVLPAPMVTDVALDYDFPAYTGVPDRANVEGGNVDAIEGTIVTVHARTSQPASLGRLNMGAKIGPLPMAPKPGDAQELIGKFTVTADGAYTITFTTTGGQSNPEPVVYDIKARRDNPPTAKITKPGPSIKLPSNAKQAVTVEAADDYGVKEVFLKVFEGAKQVAFDTLPMPEPRRKLVNTFEIDLARLNARPGMKLQYAVTVRDTKEPQPNKFETPRFEIEVVEPARREEVAKLDDQVKKDKKDAADAQNLEDGKGPNDQPPPQQVANNDPPREGAEGNPQQGGEGGEGGKKNPADDRNLMARNDEKPRPGEGEPKDGGQGDGQAQPGGDDKPFSEQDLKKLEQAAKNLGLNKPRPNKGNGRPTQGGNQADAPQPQNGNGEGADPASAQGQEKPGEQVSRADRKPKPQTGKDAARPQDPGNGDPNGDVSRGNDSNDPGTSPPEPGSANQDQSTRNGGAQPKAGSNSGPRNTPKGARHPASAEKPAKPEKPETADPSQGEAGNAGMDPAARQNQTGRQAKPEKPDPTKSNPTGAGGTTKDQAGDKPPGEAGRPEKDPREGAPKSGEGAGTGGAAKPETNPNMAGKSGEGSPDPKGRSGDPTRTKSEPGKTGAGDPSAEGSRSPAGTPNDLTKPTKPDATQGGNAPKAGESPTGRDPSAPTKPERPGGKPGTAGEPQADPSNPAGNNPAGKEGQDPKTGRPTKPEGAKLNAADPSKPVGDPRTGQGEAGDKSGSPPAGAGSKPDPTKPPGSGQGSKPGPDGKPSGNPAGTNPGEAPGSKTGTDNAVPPAKPEGSGEGSQANPAKPEPGQAGTDGQKPGAGDPSGTKPPGEQGLQNQRGTGKPDAQQGTGGAEKPGNPQDGQKPDPAAGSQSMPSGLGKPKPGEGTNPQPPKAGDTPGGKPNAKDGAVADPDQKGNPSDSRPAKPDQDMTGAKPDPSADPNAKPTPGRPNGTPPGGKPDPSGKPTDPSARPEPGQADPAGARPGEEKPAPPSGTNPKPTEGAPHPPDPNRKGPGNSQAGSEPKVGNPPTKPPGSPPTESRSGTKPETPGDPAGKAGAGEKGEDGKGGEGTNGQEGKGNSASEAGKPGEGKGAGDKPGEGKGAGDKPGAGKGSGEKPGPGQGEGSKPGGAGSNPGDKAGGKEGGSEAGKPGNGSGQPGSAGTPSSSPGGTPGPAGKPSEGGSAPGDARGNGSRAAGTPGGRPGTGKPGEGNDPADRPGTEKGDGSGRNANGGGKNVPEPAGNRPEDKTVPPSDASGQVPEKPGESVAPDSGVLAIRKIQDLLKEDRVTPDVEKQLGMSKGEMEQFVKRYEKSARPKAPGRAGREIKVKGETKPERVFDPNRKAPEALPNVAVSNKSQRQGSDLPTDTNGGLSEGADAPVPKALRGRFNAYKTSTGNSGAGGNSPGRPSTAGGTNR